MQLSYRKKIFFLFIFLTLALSSLFVYFSYDRYQKSLDASTRALSAEITSAVSAIIHQIQIERGLTSGHIAQADSTYAKLTEQYIKTDVALKRFRHYVNLDSAEKRMLVRFFKNHNEPIIRKAKNLLNDLKNIRRAAKDHNLSFERAIAYYSEINSVLLRLSYNLYRLNQDQFFYGGEVYRLQSIKEYAGLERAYIYNQLLSKRYTLKEISIVRNLIEEQKKETKILLSGLTDDVADKYNEMMDSKVRESIESFRNSFFKYILTSNDAQEWFDTSTKRINKLQLFAEDRTNSYIAHMKLESKKAQNELWLILGIGLLAFLVVLFLAWTLYRMLKKEDELVKDLEIASQAFDSHEAMTITDKNVRILKINKAFSKITGYEPDEVVGKNPRILASGIHPESFYRNMWFELKTKDHWKGEVLNKRKSGEVYPERLSITAIRDKDGVVTNYLAQFLDISDLKKAEEQAQHQAAHDFLTELPNRRSMLQRLQEECSRAQRHNFYSAFLFIDIDDFKKINDVYGHTIGDKLLVELSGRLRKIIRKEDFVSRISGDEFCVIAVNIGNEEDIALSAAKKVSAQVLEYVNAAYTFGSKQLHISASVGIRLFPGKNCDIEEIINNADTAMYKAKELGKDRSVFFDKETEEKVRKIAQMERELHNAFDNDELVFYFQPKIGVQTGKIVGAELLSRWNHPEHGLLFPGDYMEPVKKIGKMPRMNSLVLDTACQFLSEYSDMFDGTVSVNIGVQELRTELLVGQVMEYIEKYNIDPSRLEIEILENDLIEDFDAVSANMNKLKEYGIQFSIDDFGVGYSSINYLHKLPVNKLKIDRNFVIRLKEERIQEVVAIAVNFAKVFGLKTVLEGVDEEYQLDFARKKGVEIYQGYLFSKAVEKESFKQLLEANGK